MSANKEQFEAAITRFKDGEISLGKAAALVGVSKREMVAELGRRGIPSVRYNPNQLDEEMRLLIIAPPNIRDFEPVPLPGETPEQLKRRNDIFHAVFDASAGLSVFIAESIPDKLRTDPRDGDTPESIEQRQHYLDSITKRKP